MMDNRLENFPQQAAQATRDPRVQEVFGSLEARFVTKRAQAVADVPGFELLRDQAVEIKDHVLAHLDLYLEHFSEKLAPTGGQCHFAATAQEACLAVEGILNQAGVRSLVKGKTMLSEEIALNPWLERAGIQVVETDLGEYIIQLREEPPSHVIAPALHVRARDVAQTFRAHHQAPLDPERRLDNPQELLTEAREILRPQYFSAGAGLTGANFLVAQTATAIIVTNEGNGDLCRLLPPLHIVLVGIEKLVPTLEDASVMLRILARSATGQELSTYTSFFTGPRRGGALHVVFVDNGRSGILASDKREILRCLRCGACMNHCPVFAAVGGHAYGWVYGGPLGAALNPGLRGVAAAKSLPEASSFCGRCAEVCPVRIPLPDIMRAWRAESFRQRLPSRRSRWALRLWGLAASAPRLYGGLSRCAMGFLALIGRRRGYLRRMPLARGWTQERDLPAPSGGSFDRLWRAEQAAERMKDKKHR